MNITPAIDFEKLSANLSAEEFQEKLCTWLQKNGLLCELRNYFRTNMITVFSKTASGSCITKDIKPVTPKLYVIHLLIAEFLALAECHYSLSVFCAEASVVNLFPSTREDNIRNFRFEPGKFSKTEVHDVLETLGILEESELGNLIYCTYYNSTDSLLMCILTARCSTKIVVPQVEVCKESDDCCAFAIDNIDKLLRKNNLSYESQLQIKHYIKQMHEKQREKGLLTEKNLKQKYKNEIAKYKQKVKDAQSSFNSEKVQLERTVFELELLLGICGPDQYKKEKFFPGEQDRDKENLLTFQPRKNSATKKLALTTQDVEQIQLKLLLKQLQTENKKLCDQNSNYMKQLEHLNNKVDLLLSDLKNLRDNKNVLQSYESKNNDQIIPRHAFEQAKHDEVVQEAQYKLKMLELECDSITNFKYVKHAPKIITS